MNLSTVQEIERAIAALTPEQREELYAWLDEHYSHPGDARLTADIEAGRFDERISRAVVHGGVLAEMRAIRARLKPDPQGWTTRDYIQYGRH